jgi:CrcB protein
VTALLVLLGGAVGAPLRYLIDRCVQSRSGAIGARELPLGTLLVNVIGSFLLGLITAGVSHQGWSPQVQTLVGTGFCGGLTTFSTFSVETVQLTRQGRTAAALGYVGFSCLLGVGAAAAGYALLR